MTDIFTTIDRLQRAQREFDRVAGETLALLAEADSRAAATDEALAAIDQLEERLSQ
jgi:anti-sigma factor ChrR (cupin superfamily)